MVAATGKASLDQEHAEFVAIQPGGVRFVTQFRAPKVHRREHRDQLFLDAVPVEPGNRRQSPTYRRPSLAILFETAGKQLDVGRLTANTRKSWLVHHPSHCRRSKL